MKPDKRGVRRNRVARINRIKERNYRKVDCRDCKYYGTNVCKECVRKDGLNDEATDYFEEVK